MPFQTFVGFRNRNAYTTLTRAPYRRDNILHGYETPSFQQTYFICATDALTNSLWSTIGATTNFGLPNTSLYKSLPESFRRFVRCSSAKTPGIILGPGGRWNLVRRRNKLRKEIVPRGMSQGEETQNCLVYSAVSKGEPFPRFSNVAVAYGINIVYLKLQAWSYMNALKSKIETNKI